MPEVFLRHLDAARNALRFELWAYVVMPEHVHVLIKPLEANYSVSEVLSAIKSPAAREIYRLHPHLREASRIERNNRPPEYRFWQQGGGYDRNLFSVRSIWNEIHYIHQNPVKRGLCEVPIDWTWTSAGAYAEAGPETFIPVDLCRSGLEW